MVKLTFFFRRKCFSSNQCKTDRFPAKFAQQFTESAVFYRSFLGEIPAKSPFFAFLTQKTPRNLSFFSATYQKPTFVSDGKCRKFYWSSYFQVSMKTLLVLLLSFLSFFIEQALCYQAHNARTEVGFACGCLLNPSRKLSSKFLSLQKVNNQSISLFHECSTRVDAIKLLFWKETVFFFFNSVHSTKR